MFYKNEFNKESKELIIANPLEFVVALKDRMQSFLDTGYLIGYDKNENVVMTKPILFKDELHGTVYLTERGLLNFSNYKSRKLKDDNSSIHTLKIVKKEIDTSSLNPAMLKKIQSITSDFFQPKLKKQVQDRLGDSYQMIYLKNADSTIGDNLIVDTIFLFNGEEQIGYLKAKYTTKKISKTIGLLKPNDVFLNVATIDYSHLKENYRGKGLGYLMYFHMAKQLNANSIEFRQSVLNSDEAKRLWSGIQKHWSPYTKLKNIRNDKCCFLKMTQSMSLTFNGNVPEIKKIRIKHK